MAKPSKPTKRVWLVETRWTLEWGGRFEADSEEEARALAVTERGLLDATVIEESTICLPLDEEE